VCFAGKVFVVDDIAVQLVADGGLTAT